MTASVIRKVEKGERKRLDLPWFTQKASKAPGTELALFTEAAGTRFKKKEFLDWHFQYELFLRIKTTHIRMCIYM